MDALIFAPLKITCPQCFERIDVSIEGLRYQDEVGCQKCGHRFIPNIDVDALLEIIKAIETGKLVPPNEDEK